MSSTQEYRVEFCFDEFELLDGDHFGYTVDSEVYRDPETGRYFDGNKEEIYPDIDIDDVEEIDCDPEADTECDEELCDPEAETDDEEESVYESLQRYREQKKKVLDSFELLKPDEHPYDYDLYRDIETGRVFDLDGEEYFQQNQ